MKQTELKKRVLTGVIGGAVLLSLIILAGRIGVAFIAVILSLGMLYEFTEMVFGLGDKSEKRFVLLGTGWLVAFFNFWIPRVEYQLLLIVFIGLFCYFLFTAERHKSQLDVHFQELMFSLFAALYLIFFPLFFPLLADTANGMKWTILFLFIVWMGDTVAYFVGKKYGQRKLYPLISPKKTIEGALGGLGASLVVSIIFKLIFFRSLSFGATFIVPILVGIVSQVGDLCESFLKRAYHRKDSGAILPGHGGFLDRFDGVVFSLPIIYACARLFS